MHSQRMDKDCQKSRREGFLVSRVGDTIVFSHEFSHLKFPHLCVGQKYSFFFFFVDGSSVRVRSIRQS